MGLVCGGQMGGQDGVLWAVGCPGSVYLIPTSPYLQNIICWRVVLVASSQNKESLTLIVYRVSCS